jgi:hypothetical protein
MLPQPLICVADVEQTSAWFQRTLGFVSVHGGPEYEQLQSDGAIALQLHRWDAHEHRFLGNPAVKPYGNGVALWFMCENVEATYERAVKAGGEVLEPLHVNPLAQRLCDRRGWQLRSTRQAGQKLIGSLTTNGDRSNFVRYASGSLCSATISPSFRWGLDLSGPNCLNCRCETPMPYSR